MPRAHRERCHVIGGRRPPPAAGARRHDRLQDGHNLALPLSSLVGRAEAQEEVARLVRAGRLVTLTGTGGVGKSRLALAVAADLSRHGEPVALVAAGTLSDPGSVRSAVATGLGLPGGERALVEDVVHAVGDDGLLLVLDGCEHLRGCCAELVAEMLGTCPGLRVLATSRERLGIAGEAVWPVPALSLPGGGRPRLPHAVVASAAVQLFCERAAALQRGFVATPDNIEAVVEICRRLDGNPLAIELAAGRVVALPPAEIAVRLDDPFALLIGGPTTAPVRQQSLRASMEWDHALLSGPERTLLARLSVFPGGFRVAAAEAVGAGGHVEPDQVLDLLRGLIDKSLVVNESTACAARFRLLRTVRAYAAERLEEAGSTQAVAERHAAWCLALVEAGSAERSAARGRDWMLRLEADLDSVVTALEWALSQVGDHPSAHALFDEAAAAARRAHLGHLQARALTGGAKLALGQGDVAGALSRLDRALAVARRQADKAAEANALEALAQVQHRPTAFDLLTPAEGKVAALAAQGLPNAVIARELVVSRRTVETHLQRAYAKLGIRSRKQLPAFVRTDEETRT